MGNNDDGGPAFPMGYHPEGNPDDQFGMSLLEHYVGCALHGLCANPNTYNWSFDVLANSAMKQAKAALAEVLAERERRKEAGR